MDAESPLSSDLEIPIERVSDDTVLGPNGEIPVRQYEPRADRSQSSPSIVFFHGGGWISGSIDTHNRVCRKMANVTGYPIVSVDYRLAPENPFPAGLLDCYSVLEWVSNSAAELGVDPDQTIVMGDSAGGNLAAATALLARDRDGPKVAHQVLIYPAVGDARTSEAYKQNATGYDLTADIVDMIYELYTDSDIDDANYYAWPRKANDLSGLPPATVLTAGFDPLRDDGALYAERLRKSNVSTSFSNYEDLTHGFFAMIGDPIDIEKVHQAYRDISERLHAQFDSQ
nr:alpha/beta hydrolase [Halogranum gelatinilyticum]